MWTAAVLTILVLVSPLYGDDEHNHHLKTRFINQPVDHFNPFDRRNFDQRFMQNTEFFEPGGPIFIYLTGGEEIEGVYDEFITSGLVYEIANETSGLLVALEHRYFGASRPTLDTSFENLQWLNIHQAVGDIAGLINFLRQSTGGTETSRVILWGRGYAASLGIWARQKYPNLVDGVFASSPQLDAVVEHSQVLVNAYRTISNIGGPECGQTIRGAFEMLDDAFIDGNTTFIMERLKLCEELDSSNILDLARLDFTIAFTSFQFLKIVRYPEIDEKCRIMTGADTPENPPIDDLDGFARWYIDDLNANRDCFDYRNDVIVAAYSDPEWDSVSTIDGRRQRLWIQCTVMGGFPITDEGTEHPYGRRFRINFFRRWCADAFGSDLFIDPWFMEDTIGLTNQYFGGLNPNVRRVIMTQGEMDPMRTLAPLSDLNDEARVIVINLESYSRDLGSPSEVIDYPHLVQTKQTIRESILEFLRLGEVDQPTPPPPTEEPPPIGNEP